MHVTSIGISNLSVGVNVRMNAFFLSACDPVMNWQLARGVIMPLTLDRWDHFQQSPSEPELRNRRVWKNGWMDVFLPNSDTC